MEGILGYHTATDPGTYLVYTAPSDKYVKCNVSFTSLDISSSDMKLYITSDPSPMDSDIVQVEKIKASRRGFDRGAIILKPEESIFYTTNSSNVACVATGIEYETIGNEVVTSSVGITSPGDYTLFTCGASSTCSINVTVTLNNNSGVDNLNATLYVTKTDIASGVAIQHMQLNMDTLTGVERASLVLSEGDKVILAVGSLVGNASARVHGFERGAK